MRLRGILIKGTAVFSFMVVVQTAFAQFGIGPKVGYNSFQETVGVGGQMAIIASEKFRVSADFMKHFSYGTSSSETSDPFRNSTSMHRAFHELNFNFSYLFKTGKAYFYPIVGMNIAYYDEYVYNSTYTKYSPTSSYYDKYVGSSNVSKTDSKAGLNIGGGAQYDLGFISPFIECKYSISDIENGSIGAGVLLNFGRGKKQE